MSRMGWLFVCLLCELHLVAIICRESLMQLAKETARGTLYTALCTSHGEQMTVFRRCLYEEIVATLDIMVGSPPPSAIEYRSRMINLFFNSFNKVNKAVVQLLPNGDWRNRKRVEFYPPRLLVGAFAHLDKRNISHVFACAMIKTFLSLAFQVHASHHWTGYDVATDQQGGLESCHGFCRRTARRFLMATSGSKTRTTPRPDLLRMLDGDAPLDLMTRQWMRCCKMLVMVCHLPTPVMPQVAEWRQTRRHPRIGQR